jgi:hypothetical protein
LTFRNPPDLVQMQATLALNVFGSLRRAKKRVRNHYNGGYCRATHRKYEFPIGRDCIQ